MNALKMRIKVGLCPECLIYMLWEWFETGQACVNKRVLIREKWFEFSWTLEVI